MYSKNIHVKDANLDSQIEAAHELFIESLIPIYVSLDIILNGIDRNEDKANLPTLSALTKYEAILEVFLTYHESISNIAPKRNSPAYFIYSPLFTQMKACQGHISEAIEGFTQENPEYAWQNFNSAIQCLAELAIVKDNVAALLLTDQTDPEYTIFGRYYRFLDERKTIPFVKQYLPLAAQRINKKNLN